ncbi:peptidoglycan-binding protein [Bacillus sp. JCM 19034]|uniref:C40 family peptidase n=1 Tax=Bacillus sp. JCM 19034 TaxID=1481928 RepID=UPI000785B8BF|nr:peptidoglycan-binding protein [Bacillus sp. JCM 19034]
MNKTLKKAVISSAFATGLLIATPQVADAALGDQTLRKGMNDPDVKDLQDALKKKGFFNYDQSTGYYGDITQDAVRKFQKEHNLTVDGIAGPQTLNKLLQLMEGNAAPPTSSNSNSKSSSSSQSTSLANHSTLIRSGQSGNHVEELQKLLKEEGYFRTDVTGYFGRVTETAVKDFQRDMKIKVDGIVGPQTISKLLNENKTEVKEPEYKPSLPKETSKLDPTKIYRIGSTGQAVNELQSQLRSVGVFQREPTGYYGEITADAVRSFQRLHNLKVDGIAGPQTLKKLQEIATNKNGGSNSNASNGSGSSSNSSAFVTNVVADAATLIGVPYVWGGTTTNGFDCSGFVQYVFNKQGVSIPRTVALQWNAGKSVSKPAVGDIVFFDTTGGPSHNGIYIGNNQFVHSGSSTGVTIANLDNSYWSQRYLGAKRLH